MFDETLLLNKDLQDWIKVAFVALHESRGQIDARSALSIFLSLQDSLSQFPRGQVGLDDDFWTPEWNSAIFCSSPAMHNPFSNTLASFWLRI